MANSGAIGSLAIGLSPIGIVPQSMTTVIPSYLYAEYSDDDDLQAFVAAYNTLAQIYIDWFNNANLPIYTTLSGALLDWVGQGVYGKARPTLFSNQSYLVGELNTYALNALGFNEGGIVNNITNVAVTNDDYYKRVLTWHFYKGDGKQASAQWFRRRATRFLYGPNGSDYSTPVENVSVLVGGGSMTITVVSSLVKMVSGSFFNSFAFNAMGFNTGAIATTATFTVPDSASTFVEAVNSGALEAPAEYSMTARIGPLGVHG